MGENKWDELALLNWNQCELDRRVFHNDWTPWSWKDCLKQMGAFNRRVLKFAVERIMKERVQRDGEKDKRIEKPKRLGRQWKAGTHSIVQDAQA